MPNLDEIREGFNREAAEALIEESRMVREAIQKEPPSKRIVAALAARQEGRLTPEDEERIFSDIPDVIGNILSDDLFKPFRRKLALYLTLGLFVGLAIFYAGGTIWLKQYQKELIEASSISFDARKLVSKVNGLDKGEIIKIASELPAQSLVDRLSLSDKAIEAAKIVDTDKYINGDFYISWNRLALNNPDISQRILASSQNSFIGLAGVFDKNREEAVKMVSELTDQALYRCQTAAYASEDEWAVSKWALDYKNALLPVIANLGSEHRTKQFFNFISYAASDPKAGQNAPYPCLAANKVKRWDVNAQRYKEHLRCEVALPSDFK